MNYLWIDIAVACIFLISVLVGVFRGFVRELLSVLSWVAALLVAWKYGEYAQQWISPYISSPELSLAVAYVVVFLIALIVFSVISYLISRVFSAAGMTGLDRSLGSVFGAIRAAFVVALAILAGSFMAFNEHSWWTDSQLLGYFEPLADWIFAQLPESWQAEIRGKPEVS